MEKPSPSTQEVAMNHFLIYQKAIDEHEWHTEADKKKMIKEADYWRKVYEEADDGGKIIEHLGLTVDKNI